MVQTSESKSVLSAFQQVQSINIDRSFASEDRYHYRETDSGFGRAVTTLHDRFQSFGRPVYEEVRDRRGRLCLEGCAEYSPVYCDSARGYYEGALEMMKVPGPIRVVETACQCAGEPACLYELSW